MDGEQGLSSPELAISPDDDAPILSMKSLRHPSPPRPPQLDRAELTLRQSPVQRLPDEAPAQAAGAAPLTNGIQQTDDSRLDHRESVPGTAALPASTAAIATGPSASPARPELGPETRTPELPPTSAQIPPAQPPAPIVDMSVVTATEFSPPRKQADTQRPSGTAIQNAPNFFIAQPAPKAVPFLSQIHQHSYAMSTQTATRSSADQLSNASSDRLAPSTTNSPMTSPSLWSLPSSQQGQGDWAPPDKQLHYYQNWKHKPPIETHAADISRNDQGKKMINQYEVIDELGRGVHGKVKLGRNTETGEEVAIKIVERFPKRRRFGKAEPESKVKQEIAILKKCRHPNVVSLLEVIDDVDLNKVYLILELLRPGEIKWRVKGDSHACKSERERVQRAIRLVKRGLQPEMEGSLSKLKTGPADLIPHRHRKGLSWKGESPNFWSLEYGDTDDDEPPKSSASDKFPPSAAQGLAAALGQRSVSAQTSKANSPRSVTPLPTDLSPVFPPARSTAIDNVSTIAVDQSSYASTRNASVVSNMSSVVGTYSEIDPYEEEYSYAPCLTFDEVRKIFRDTVLGLEYLHFHGVIHRDIKPANLLWNEESRVKISDFGVSYLGRPIRDNDYSGEESGTDDDGFSNEAVELAKTVGTPAFYAPELCITDLDEAMKYPVTGQIDLWALGVTLYCIIYARVPFMPTAETSLFEAIAKEVPFISKKRLRPDKYSRPSSEMPSAHSTPAPPTPVSAMSSTGVDDSIYEDVDQDLRDLIKALLEKDPNKRITLREVKHHPWLLKGMRDPMAWIERTDTARVAQGQQIKVSEKEVKEALVPFSLVQRVKHGIQRGIRAITGRSVRDGGRRRAVSNTDSGEAEKARNAPPPPLPSAAERKFVHLPGLPRAETHPRPGEGHAHPHTTSLDSTAHIPQDHIDVRTPAPMVRNASGPAANALRQVNVAPSPLQRALSTSSSGRTVKTTTTTGSATGIIHEPHGPPPPNTPDLSAMRR